MDKRLKIFLLLFYVTFVAWLFSVFFCETQQRVFFAVGQDFFADFFNNVRYVAGRDPYFDTTIASSEHIYPPICYLIFYPFACLIRWCGAVQLPDDALSVFWSSPVAVAVCAFFMVASIAPLAWVVWKISSRGVAFSVRGLLLASFLLSGIAMFSFERGNIVVLAASALAVFMACGKARTGLAALSFAISIKIYPAAFVSVMLRRREYRNVFLLVFCVGVLGFLPLLFFKHGMLENALQLLQNVKAQGVIYYNACPPNLTVSSYVAAAAQVLNVEWLSCAAKIVRCFCFVLGIVSFVGVMFVRETWKSWFLAATAATLCSNFAGYYTLLYFMPAIFAYLSSGGRFGKMDWLYSIACVVFLTPLQFGLVPVRHDSINPFVSGCLICAVAIAILVERFGERNSGLRSDA